MWNTGTPIIPKSLSLFYILRPITCYIPAEFSPTAELMPKEEARFSDVERYNL